MALNSIPKTHWLLFLGSVLLLVLHHIFGTIGHYGFDDMEYARIAAELSKGGFTADHHFAYRWALIVPTALSYWLFGINDLSSAIPPLLCSAFILFFVMLFLSKQSLKTLSLALSLTLLSPWFLRYSGMIMSDIYLALAFMAAAYCLWKAQEERHLTALGIGFSLSLFYGLLAKGTIILILPAVLIIFLINLKQRNVLRFWLAASLSGIVLLAAYLFSIYLISGSPWHRFELIAEHSYLNRCSYAAQNWRVLINRISVGFLRMLQADHLLPFYLLLLPVVVSRLRKKSLKLNDPLYFMSLFSILLLLSANFMSISITDYNPMCLDIRHYLFLIPTAAIAVAILLSRPELLKSLKWWLMLALLLSLGVVIGFDNPDLLIHCGPLILILMILILGSYKEWVRRRLWVLLPIILLLKPIDLIRSAQAYDYPAQRAFVIDKVIKTGEAKSIFTDPVMSRLGNYYLGFQHDKMRFYSFAEVKLNSKMLGKPVYYLRNPASQGQSFYDNNDLPIEIRELIKETPLQVDNDLGMAVYPAGDKADLKANARLIESSINDFEAAVDPWNQRSDLLLANPKDSLDQVSFVPEYSSTYLKELNGLIKPNQRLLIEVSADLWLEKQEAVKLVISIEEEDGSYIWEAQDIDPFVKSYSNWWEVRFEKLINGREIKADSRLKVYVWNPGKGSILIDDLKIELYRL